MSHLPFFAALAFGRIVVLPSRYVSYLPFLIPLAFVLGAVLSILYRLFRSGPREMKSVVEYAQRRGFALVNPTLAQAVEMSPLEMMKNPARRNLERASLDIANIAELDQGTGDWLAFNCKLRSKEVTIFNLSVTSRQGSGGAGIHYKVAKIKATGLPRFSLGRNSAMHKFENAVDKLAHLSQPEIRVDARLYPEFAAHFWIKGPDAAAVTAFLSGDKIRFLASANLTGTLATNANYLVYFEDGKLQTAQDFDSFIGRVETIVANFL
jgi:hypothetical protein